MKIHLNQLNVEIVIPKMDLTFISVNDYSDLNLS